MPPEPRPRAGVVLPTGNGRDLSLAALGALERQTFRHFGVVMDNAGTDGIDGTGEAVPARHPRARLEPLPGNAGFAGCVSHGIRAARGEIVVLLNDDIEAAPVWKITRREFRALLAPPLARQGDAHASTEAA